MKHVRLFVAFLFSGSRRALFTSSARQSARRHGNVCLLDRGDACVIVPFCALPTRGPSNGGLVMSMSTRYSLKDGVWDTLSQADVVSAHQKAAARSMLCVVVAPTSTLNLVEPAGSILGNPRARKKQEAPSNDGV